MKGAPRWLVWASLLAVALAAPLVAPNYQSQGAFLWVMTILALTWDLLGGQMGYNSFGNIVSPLFDYLNRAVVARRRIGCYIASVLRRL